MKEKSVRLYRYLHIEKGYGKPFALCDKHEKEYNPPAKSDNNLIFEKMADESLIECFMCLDNLPCFDEDVVD